MPTQPEVERSLLATVLPALSVLGMVGFAVFAASPLLIGLSAGLAVLSVSAALLTARVQRRRAERAWRRRQERYLAHLANRAGVLQDAARRQSAYDADARERAGPRRAGEPEFLAATLGLGRRRARRPPQPPAGSPEEIGDAGLAAAAEAVLGRYAAVDAQGLTVSLGPGACVVLHGPLRGLLRSLVCELAATHHPDDLAIHTPTPDRRTAWLAALPHHRADHRPRTSPARTASWSCSATVRSAPLMTTDPCWPCCRPTTSCPVSPRWSSGPRRAGYPACCWRAPPRSLRRR